ncbi:MAG: V-type ATPase subunit [Erysipelotrichaceae bacterium]|nr:V-type ATPase subunit [Erysipelotrichaceae bacterium]MDY5251804.1 V-type ATPase subunit [Erysipelotrichaceae bacterium]
MTSMAANAMTAKAKAMLSKKLTANDYQILLQKKSVGEVASFLKNNTYFNDVLDGINEAQIHRGQLEMLVRMDLYNRISRLLRYSDKKDEEFYRLIVSQTEISIIVDCIRSFQSNDKTIMISKMPTYIQGKISFNLKELSKADNFDELLEILKCTKYYEIIKKYKTLNMDEIDYVGLEHDLNKFHFERVFEVVNRNYSGTVKNQILDVYLAEIELDNIGKIYRLKKYFNVGPNQIKAMIIPKYHYFTSREIDDMILNKKADEIFDILANSPYKNYLSNKSFLYIEYHTKSIFYNYNKRNMFFSSNTDLVLLSYVFISKIEIQNIVDIIEGIRYRVAPDKISRLLIY